MNRPRAMGVCIGLYSPTSRTSTFLTPPLLFDADASDREGTPRLDKLPSSCRRDRERRWVVHPETLPDKHGGTFEREIGRD